MIPDDKEEVGWASFDISPEGDIAIRIKTLVAYAKQKGLKRDHRGRLPFDEAMVREMLAIDQAAGAELPTWEHMIEIAKSLPTYDH